MIGGEARRGVALAGGVLATMAGEDDDEDGGRRRTGQNRNRGGGGGVWEFALFIFLDGILFPAPLFCRGASF
jgi:hypothetical protein